jgi:altronate dehydratase small subunit
MFHALQLELEDNVATVVVDVAKNATLTVQTPGATTTITAVEPIAFGHKIALQSLQKGDIVTKYGRPIGRATTNITRGGYVGVHNIEGMRGRGDLATSQGGAQ